MVMCKEPEIRLRLAKLFTQRAQTWHFVFGQMDFLATKRCKRQIGNPPITTLSE
jgi:hypothetical protein